MKRVSKGLFAIVASVAGILGLQSFANASVTYDIRVSSVNGPGLQLVDSHNINVTLTGGTVNFDVYAIVSSSNSTGTDEGFSTTRGYIAPSGAGPKGNLAGGTLASPFNDAAAAVGQNVDINSDGFLDYGTLTSTTSSVIPHAPSPGASGGDSTPPEFKLYSFSMLVSSLGAGTTQVGWTNVATGTSAQWKEDGATKFASTGVVAPALVTNLVSAVPEPASLGILALGGMTLLARRRKSA